MHSTSLREITLPGTSRQHGPRTSFDHAAKIFAIIMELNLAVLYAGHPTKDLMLLLAVIGELFPFYSLLYVLLGERDPEHVRPCFK